MLSFYASEIDRSFYTFSDRSRGTELMGCKKHYRSYRVLWGTGGVGVMIIITGESTDCSPPPAALGNMGDIFTAQVTTTINITTSHL